MSMNMSVGKIITPIKITAETKLPSISTFLKVNMITLLRFWRTGLIWKFEQLVCEVETSEISEQSVREF